MCMEIQKFMIGYEFYVQILAAISFFIGTLFLAFSLEIYNPKYNKHFQPMRVKKWKFRLGIFINLLGFFLIVLANLAKLSD